MFNLESEECEDYRDESWLKALAESFKAADDSTYFDSDTLEEIASYYFEKGRYEESIRVIDRLLDTYPYSSDGWMRRGVVLNNLGRHQDALVAYDRVLALNPTDIETIVNRGITLDGLDRTE